MVEISYIPLEIEKYMIQKSWYQSKTVWFNIIAFIMLVLALPQFISIEPASWIPYITAVVAIGNLFLRVFSTAQPILATPVVATPVAPTQPTI